jgi:hypothetical protein
MGDVDGLGAKSMLEGRAGLDYKWTGHILAT